MNTNEQITAMQLQLDQLEEKIKLMRQLRTFDGFYHFFFSQIDKHKNRSTCFHHCNEVFFELYGEYRYSDYGTFRKAITLNRKR